MWRICFADDCRLGLQKDRQCSTVLSKGLWRPTPHPQNFTEPRTLESHFSRAPVSIWPTDYFKWSGELKHTPPLSCSVAGLFTVIFSSSPLPGGKSRFQAGSHWVKGSPGQGPVTGFFAFARKGGREEFLTTASSSSSGVALHTQLA